MLAVQMPPWDLEFEEPGIRVLFDELDKPCDCMCG